MRVLTLGLLAAIPLFAQNSLVLSSGASALNLTLTSRAGVQPAAIQWTLTYSPNEVLSIQAAAAGSAAAAGKTITCAGAAGTYRCVLSGANSTVIPDGVVAVVTFVAAAGVTSSAVGVTNSMGATSAGFGLALTGTGGAVVPPQLRRHRVRVRACAGYCGSDRFELRAWIAGRGGGRHLHGDTIPYRGRDRRALQQQPRAYRAAGGRGRFQIDHRRLRRHRGERRDRPDCHRDGKTERRFPDRFDHAVARAGNHVIRLHAIHIRTGRQQRLHLTLSRTGGGTISLSSNNAALTVPPAVAVASASTTATFAATAGNVGSSQTATVTAKLNGSTQSASLGLQPATQTALGIASLNCVPDLSAAGSLSCSIQLTRAAPAGGVQVTIQSSSARLQPPASIRISTGQQGATFAIHVIASDQDLQTQVTASIPGAARTISISITGARPTAVVLAAATITAGTRLSGEIRLNPSNVPDFVTVALSATTSNLRVPASIVFRPGQTRATFQISADRQARAGSAEIVAQFGQTVVRSRLSITFPRSPFLIVPQEITARFGEEAAFTASAFDPQGLPVVYSVDSLPKGATFDAATGSFSWMPEPSQAAIYKLVGDCHRFRERVR